MFRVNKFLAFTVLFFLLSIELGFSQSADLIDFEDIETVHGLLEGNEVFLQYEGLDCGVRFHLGSRFSGNHPRISQIGFPATGFSGPMLTDANCNITSATSDDMPDPSANAGCWFLTDDAIHSGQPTSTEALIVEYVNPTSQASGDLLDVDVNERWKISAWLYQGGTSFTQVGTDLIVDFNSGGNGLASHWSFDFSLTGQVFDELRFEYDNPSSTHNVGLAFDNFSACSVQPAENYCCGTANSIKNGNFEAGNAFFTSNYSHQSTIQPNSVLPGQYSIVNSAQAATISPNWNVTDHSACDPSMNFMVVNGATQNQTTPLEMIYGRQITLKEDQEYIFCAAFKNLPQCSFDVLPEITIEITGSPSVTQTINVNPNDPCAWQEITFSLTNIPSPPVVSLKIYLDQTGNGDGNDLAIDNIAIQEVNQVSSAFTIWDLSPENVGPNTMNFTGSYPPLPDASCAYSWTVCEVDLSNGTACIAGTEVTAPTLASQTGPWATFPADNWFNGYNGTSTLGNIAVAGIFDVNKSYKFTYGVECECLSYDEVTYYYEPGSFSRKAEILREDSPRIQELKRKLNSSNSSENSPLIKGDNSLILNDGFDISAFPNPTQNEFQLDFSLPAAGKVHLDIWDMQGRVVTRLLEEERSSGSHTLNVSLKDQPVGTYFVRIRQNDHSETIKIMKR